MGNYNSYQPQILGQEWVPIREEDQVFSPAVNSIEVGHKFTLTTSRTLQDARFYINDPAPGRGLGQVFLAAVYPSGFEDQTGPIERLVIPCNSGGITGSTVILSNATTVDQAVFDPSDNKSIIFSGAGTGNAQFFFATNSYAIPLIGKRILAVNLLYSTAIAQGAGNSTVGPGITIEDDAGNGVFNTYGNMVGPDSLSQVSPIGRARFGEVNQFWSASLSPNNTTDRMPWNWAGLQRFEASASTRIRVMLTSTTGATDDIRVGYMALEVIYCEEQRVALGGRSFGESAFSGQNKQYVPGVNIIPMRTIAQVTNPVLAAGTYSLVLSSPDIGDFRALTSFPVASTTYPDLNAVRELYSIPAHPGVRVDIPFPPEDHLGETFTETQTHILPQLSLHASGGTLTEPHVYGRQGAAQIYGSSAKAEQEIYDDAVGVATVYQQVRFYARRFGTTTDTLDLFGIGAIAGVTTPGISPSEWDALDEIIDGWKEVTLRFTNPPTLGAVANPKFRFEAATEVAGSRWEILAACAPAVSGIPGNLFNLAPSADQLASATYQPPLGSTVALSWMPQGVGSPYVSGNSLDQTCDAVLILSQDPPTVSGLSLTQLTQTVTGIGFDCGSLPCCIPSGIGYQRLTWTASSLPVSGFGAYELQRWDQTVPNFETIMLASSRAVTGFNDYEARVGINSVYRIRALNVYNFAGLWSLQVTGAPPTPGVTGGCNDQTGALIFTSNAMQSGASNAAYVMQWEGSPDESFDLPEADEVQFQPMYGRDGRVAFHGTERGLESFDRTLLIQAAAIDPVRLADVKTLRDLAWNDLPYICVRDDIGDRWYANVRVPTTNARHNRTKYMARVSIVETTTTPFPVDPT